MKLSIFFGHLIRKTVLIITSCNLRSIYAMHQARCKRSSPMSRFENFVNAKFKLYVEFWIELRCWVLSLLFLSCGMFRCSECRNTSSTSLSLVLCSSVLNLKSLQTIHQQPLVKKRGVGNFLSSRAPP